MVLSLDAPLHLVLKDRSFDLTQRALVMGIVNRTPDSFYDKGKFFDLSECLTHAENLIASGADIIDVGGVKAGPGEHVSLEEELDRVIPVVDALASRFDVAISIDSWQAEVAKKAAFAVGATIGNDISGFRDARYLQYAADAKAAIVATHIRLAPRVPDPNPTYDDVVAAVRSFLLERLERALDAGIAKESIIFDAGLDLGKTAAQSLTLLRDSGQLAMLGQPLLLSASNKTFLGEVCALLPGDRFEASLAACALGYLRGCRIMRVHDALGTRRVLDMLERIVGS